MKRRFPQSSHWMSVTAAVIAVCSPGALADEFASQREAVLALGQLIEPPAIMRAPEDEGESTPRAIYYDALPWQGNPTKVFAWVGLPDNRTGPVPGVVLVHGGGGTAFKEWVTRWNAHGFAAISIAVEGQIDVRPEKEPGEANGWWKQHVWAGPRRQGIYDDSSEPPEDQWMYHAVADTILANSLLRSLPEVDAEKVGLMGISWGGVIASTVVGIDDRFAFAIPVYGCGHLFDAGNQYGRSLGDNELYKQVWDPMVRLANASMPMLWFSWPQDKHFPLDCQAASYGAAGGAHMVTLVPGMGHGHGPAWKRPEAYAFADAVLRDGGPWCRQTDNRVERGVFRAVFSSSKPVDGAVLVSSTDQGVTGEREWVATPASLEQDADDWVVTAQLPPNTTGWFVNLKSGELVVSSAYMERSPARVPATIDE